MPRYYLLTIFSMLFVIGCGSTENSESQINLKEGETAISIGGQIIKAKEAISSPIEFNQEFFNPMKQFKPIAQGMGPQEFKEKERDKVKRLLITKISDILIHQKAQEKYEGTNLDRRLEQLTDEKVRNLILEKGSLEKAEEYLEDRGMDWESYRNSEKASTVNMWYLRSELPEPRPVRYDEIVEEYEKIKDERFALDETIKGKVLKIAVSAKGSLSVSAARLEKAHLLAEKILKDLHRGVDLEAVAKMDSRISLVEYKKPVRTSSLKAELAKTAREMEPGEISGPIESRNRSYIFIMKLDSRRARSYQPVSEVEELVRREIAVNRRSKAVGQLIVRFEKQAELGLTESFVDACAEKLYEISRNK